MLSNTYSSVLSRGAGSRRGTPILLGQQGYRRSHVAPQSIPRRSADILL